MYGFPVEKGKQLVASLFYLVLRNLFSTSQFFTPKMKKKKNHFVEENLAWGSYRALVVKNNLYRNADPFASALNLAMGMAH